MQLLIEGSTLKKTRPNLIFDFHKLSAIKSFDCQLIQLIILRTVGRSIEVRSIYYAVQYILCHVLHNFAFDSFSVACEIEFISFYY